jgi:hypothetical protein
MDQPNRYLRAPARPLSFTQLDHHLPDPTDSPTVRHQGDGITVQARPAGHSPHRRERHMSSQSSTSSIGPGRRSAAVLGASAVLSLAVAAPVLAQQVDPRPSPVPPGTTDCLYMGGGSIAQCRDASLFPKGNGAGSASSAERGVPSGPVAPAAPTAPKIVVPASQPTNLPVIGVGAVTLAVVAGGMALMAANRRRPARPA